jgi:hypothetical protein
MVVAGVVAYLGLEISRGNLNKLPNFIKLPIKPADLWDLKAEERARREFSEELIK